MTDDQTLDTAVNFEIKADNVDSDKSFESCANSVNDGIINNIKDDDSEKSFKSCSLNTQDQSKTNDLLNVEEASPVNTNEPLTDDDNDDDDDIRPGSCRENASSDDELSSWDENNDSWIYDTEFLQHSLNNKDQVKTELTSEEIKSCEKDLKYIIENHVLKENIGKDNSCVKYKKDQDNPTFIPTNGKFFMHDLRLEEKSEVNDTAKQNKSSKTNMKNEKVDRWSHDLYDESKQKPVSKLELIEKYGEDIRSKNSDLDSNKVKQKRKSKRSNYKRKNYRYPPTYYDYNFGYYDNYNQQYYNDYYFDYNYYGNQYNSWGRSSKTYINSRDSNKNMPHSRNDLRNYKSNSLPTSNKKFKQKPPSKYSQIAEFTDIKITVDNIGARQIKSVNNSSLKNSGKVLENSVFRRDSDGSFQHGSLNPSVINQDYSESYQKDVPFHKKPTETFLRTNKKSIGQHEANTMIMKTNSNSKTYDDFNSRGKSSNRIEVQQSKTVYDKNHHGEFSHRPQKSIQPEWTQSKIDWEQNKQFKNPCDEDMQPLSEKEINQLQKRSFHAHCAPPRFSREKSVNVVPSNDPKSQNRLHSSMSHVPKRYSEVRNQLETPKVVGHHESISPIITTTATNSAELINYPQIISNLDYYGNLQPLLLNLTQAANGNNSASNNSPQQPSSSSLQQLMSLPSLIQTGPTGYNDNPQFFIQPVYLPPNGRLNQYSQPFQPSYAAPPSQNTSLFTMPTSPVSPQNNASINNTNSNIQPQSSRPVTGKS